MNIKKCTKCREEKEISIKYFHKNSRSKDGYAPACKVCIKSKSAKYYLDNMAKIKESNKKWYNANSAVVLERTNKWSKAHRAESREFTKKWRAKNIEKKRLLDKIYSAKKYSTVKGKLSNHISNGLYKSLRKGVKRGRHWESLIGYTVDQLKVHLEKLFKKGMSWDNYGRYGWHIDHKIPIDAFNFQSPEDIDFKKCWTLSNLQPMWWIENLQKSNKLERPFQPSLIM